MFRCVGLGRRTGEIPDDLTELDRLEELDLGGNNLTGTAVGTWYHNGDLCRIYDVLRQYSFDVLSTHSGMLNMLL